MSLGSLRLSSGSIGVRRPKGERRARQRTNPGTEFDPVYGGWNPALVLPDILQLFGIDAGSSGIGQLIDPAAAANGFDDAMSVDLSTLLGGFDPAALSADFATC